MLVETEARHIFHIAQPKMCHPVNKLYDYKLCVQNANWLFLCDLYSHPSQSKPSSELEQKTLLFIWWTERCSTHSKNKSILYIFYWILVGIITFLNWGSIIVSYIYIYIVTTTKYMCTYWLILLTHQNMTTETFILFMTPLSCSTWPWLYAEWYPFLMKVSILFCFFPYSITHHMS